MIGKQPIIALYFEIETVLSFITSGSDLGSNCLQTSADKKSYRWQGTSYLFILMDYTMHVDRISMELPTLYSKRLPVKISICPCRLLLSLQTIQTLMKCCLVLHFIWIFTPCQNICLPVSIMVMIKTHFQILSLGFASR